MTEVPESVLPNGEMYLYSPARKVTNGNGISGTRDVFINIQLTNDEADAIKFLTGINIHAD